MERELRFFFGAGKLYLLGIAFAIGLGCSAASAQDSRDHKLQVHGFATQSFLYGTNHNYLGMDTSSGSFAWTEAAVNLNYQVAPKLRLGGQLHVTRLGAFGGPVPTVDWALADYSINQWMGVRAGKVKIKWGLFNDTQDADPGYLWSLLPESVYGIDIRATNLSQYGAELYGRVPLGERLGDIDYSAYYGYYSFATNDGYQAGFQEQGLDFVHPPKGKTPGFDARWSTPLKGLKVGGSLMLYDAAGPLTNGSYAQPLAFWPTYFAQYNRKRVSAAWQYVKLVQYQTVTFNGEAASTSGTDTRAWFVMGSYRVSEKLQAGAYYTRYSVPSAGDPGNPENYFHDVVISGRYDINPHLYTKLEGHWMDGTGVGFYDFNNVDLSTPRSALVVAKLGVSF